MKCTIENVMLYKPNLEYLDGYVSMTKKCNWKCKNHPELPISDTTRNLLASKVAGCPICNREKELYLRSFAYHYPEMLKEWDYEKNTVNPRMVSKHSSKQVYWLCDKGHSFYQAINSRVYDNYNCPYCTNKAVLVGFNDLWTTHPEVAKLLANPEEGYKYTYGAVVKLDFKCPDCGEIKNTWLSDAVNRGFKCPSCSDGFSYPERVMYNFLSSCKIDFKYHARKRLLKWNENYEYDFYLPNENAIIETHGMQHYSETHDFKVTLQEQIEIDKNKENLALANGIKNYITIDCSNSNIDYIKTNILANDFLYNLSKDKNIDWKEIDKKSQSSMVKRVCQFYTDNKKTMTFEMIGEHFNLSKGTIRKYIIDGSKLGFCEYSEAEQRSLGHKICNKRRSKKVYCITTNQVFENAIVAGKYYNINPTGIRDVCRKKKWKKSAGAHPVTGKRLVWTYDIPNNFNKTDIICEDMIADIA